MSEKAELVCIGAGRMGRGIAQCVAYAGYRITLVDAKSRSASSFESLRRATISEIRSELEIIAALGGFDATAVEQIVSRVSVLPRENAGSVMASSPLVFEAVPEQIEAKRQAFALFDGHAGDDTILASTTSTMLSTHLAESTVNAERFINAHWLNPAFLMPLIELSPAEETNETTLSFMRHFFEDIGKVPIVCKASPGYIVSRIQALAMNEAARLVEEDVASASDIDKAVKYGFGLRFGVLGLLEFIDWGGGDILYHASHYLAKALRSGRFLPPAIVSEKMENGQIGLKDGKGFYDYETIDIDDYRRQRLLAFSNSLKQVGLKRDPVI